MIENKTDLRRMFLAWRRTFAGAARADADIAIGTRVLSWWERHRPASLAVYQPIRGEPDLAPLYAELTSRGVQLALPIVPKPHAALVFARWTPGEALKPDALGVPVPLEPHTLMQPQALLIPCLGFNAECVRLGYGGGFYDRTLAGNPRPLAIGVAYGHTICTFTAEIHDAALDAVITETIIHAAG